MKAQPSKSVNLSSNSLCCPISGNALVLQTQIIVRIVYTSTPVVRGCVDKQFSLPCLVDAFFAKFKSQVQITNYRICELKGSSQQSSTNDSLWCCISAFPNVEMAQRSLALAGEFEQNLQKQMESCGESAGTVRTLCIFSRW